MDKQYAQELLKRVGVNIGDITNMASANTRVGHCVASLPKSKASCVNSIAIEKCAAPFRTQLIKNEDYTFSVPDEWRDGNLLRRPDGKRILIASMNKMKQLTASLYSRDRKKHARLISSHKNTHNELLSLMK